MNEATHLYSYVNMILLSILAGGFTVLCSLLAWWASDVNRKLGTLTTFHSQQAEEISRVTSWTVGHDKQDDERHEENRTRLDRNHTSVHELRNQLSEFAMKVGIQTRRINKRDDEYGMGS